MNCGKESHYSIILLIVRAVFDPKEQGYTTRRKLYGGVYARSKANTTQAADNGNPACSIVSDFASIRHGAVSNAHICL